MENVLLRALSFILIIAAGYLFKVCGIFKEGDHRLVSKIVMNLTLPCALIYSFSSAEQDSSMLFAVVLGLLCATLPMLFAFFATASKPTGIRAFAMLNGGGYNIGCFTLPFVQSFFGPSQVVMACMFDVGNAIMVTGGSYALTSSLLRIGDDSTSPRAILKKLFSSVPFDTYLLILLLSLFQISIPAPVLTIVEPLSNANGFAAMLMIGMMMNLKVPKGNGRYIVMVVVQRLVFGAVFACLVFFLAPFPLETRWALAIVMFAPTSALAPVFTEKCGGDVGAAGFAGTLTVLIGVAIITILVVFMNSGA